MNRLIMIEWIIIVLALFSLWPTIFGHDSLGVRIFQALFMIALLWVVRNRLVRTREAAAEAKRKHDELTRQRPTGKP